MSDVENYVATIKALKLKLQIATDALEAIESVTDIEARGINDQPLKPIVKHDHETCKAALALIRNK